MCFKQFFIKKYIPPKNSKEIIFDNFKYNLKYKKIAIFAGFSNNGLISDLDLYYLKELKLNFDAIILVFDCYIFETEIKKIDNLVTAAIFKRHKTYDFGSYKIAYEYLINKNLINEVEKLLFTNNASYGPIFPLKFILDKMNLKYDFWGIIQSKQYKRHIQSWFILFNKNIIKSGYIYKFIQNIKKYKLQHSYVKKYEIKFTNYLYKKGFIYNTIVPKEIDIKKFRVNHNMNLFPVMLINKFDVPFIKAKLFTPFFYHIVDQRNEVLILIRSLNKNLYNLIINDLNKKKLLPKSFNKNVYPE